jgi:hypothetical protein
MFIYETFWINTDVLLTLLYNHACLARCLPRMVNIQELELKFESKDKLLDAFGKTNPPAKKPRMSSCVFYFDGSVLLSISILSLAFVVVFR